MPLPRNFLNDLDEAQRAMAERQRSRQEARAKRAEASQDEDASLSKEERAAKKSQKTQLDKSLTRMLVTLAELGDLEGLKRAVAAGGSLERALDRSRTPLEAALSANQIPVAHWLLDQAELNFNQRRAGAMELCSAHDAVDVLERLWERFPEVGAYQCAQIRARAYHVKTAPKMALWMDKQAAKLRRAEPAPESWSALWGALSAKDWDSAKAHLSAAAARRAQGKPAAKHEYSRHGWTPCLQAFLTDLFSADDAEALLFVLREEPNLMLEAASVDAATRPHPNFSSWARAMGPQVQERMKAYSRGELRVPLATIAGAFNARDCLEVLLKIDAFKAPLLKSQEEPQKYLWEETLFSTSAPEIYAALSQAGFDFKKQMDDGNNFLHAAFLSDHLAKAFLERLGRDLSDLIDQKNDAGLTPKGNLAKWRSYQAGRGEKAEAIFQKAAIKSVSKQGSRKKEVRAAAGPRRL